MILYFALGGGWGHLTRARAVLHTMGMAESFRVLASPMTGVERVFPKEQLIHAPEQVAENRDAGRRWIQKCLEETRPHTIFVDTFPGGLFGELGALTVEPGVQLLHVARRLRWAEYLSQVQPFGLRFHKAYLVEEIEPDHEAFLRRHSATVERLSLVDPGDSADPQIYHAIRLMQRAATPWLIVHAGADEEIRELVAYAADMQAAEHRAASVFLVSPSRPIGVARSVTHLNIFPASLLFPHVDRIITGCGFNIMRQTEAFRGKHRFIPFARKWDDQFWRGAMRRETLS